MEIIRPINTATTLISASIPDIHLASDTIKPASPIYLDFPNQECHIQYIDLIEQINATQAIVSEDLHFFELKFYINKKDFLTLDSDIDDLLVQKGSN